ncbi:MAG: hypothetical protein APU95_00175 [Hadesarchaea archaeon YNP_N21]|nr:MAG: hypothetical protein APU95_00175 [Hadesarchaea archaeon YNP_N21]
MLVFVGLGLRGIDGMSLQALREIKESEVVYAEFYTSAIPGLKISELERLVGKGIKIVSREIVEHHPDGIIRDALNKKVAFLVPGDPMVATTHVDLRLRAAKAGVVTKIVHGTSIVSAAAGISGLQSYKFGRSATIPFPDNPSQTPYEVLAENKKRGLHTLFLLDIRAEQNKIMSANEAIEILLGLEEKLGEKVFTPSTLAVVIARAGSDDSIVVADSAASLLRMDFREPPHVLIVPGRLHFVEKEALGIFASAPPEAL